MSFTDFGEDGDKSRDSTTRRDRMLTDIKTVVNELKCVFFKVTKYLKVMREVLS